MLESYSEADVKSTSEVDGEREVSVRRGAEENLGEDQAWGGLGFGERAGRANRNL